MKTLNSDFISHFSAYFVRLVDELILSIQVQFKCFALHLTEQFVNSINDTMASFIDSREHLNYRSHTHIRICSLTFFLFYLFTFFFVGEKLVFWIIDQLNSNDDGVDVNDDNDVDCGVTATTAVVAATETF